MTDQRLVRQVIIEEWLTPPRDRDHALARCREIQEARDQGVLTANEAAFLILGIAQYLAIPHIVNDPVVRRLTTGEETEEAVRIVGARFDVIHTAALEKSGEPELARLFAERREELYRMTDEGSQSLGLLTGFQWLAEVGFAQARGEDLPPLQRFRVEIDAIPTFSEVITVFLLEPSTESAIDEATRFTKILIEDQAIEHVKEHPDIAPPPCGVTVGVTITGASSDPVSLQHHISPDRLPNGHMKDSQFFYHLGKIGSDFGQGW